MNTNNIISTPEITGNIGSCKSDVTSIKTYGDWWGETRQDYLTNSCTGQVTIGVEYWNMGFIIPILLGITLFMGMTLLITFFDPI